MADRSWEDFAAVLKRRVELPLRGLRELDALRATLDRVERSLVIVASRNGSTWEEIGSALGISRQAARSRHRPFVNSTAGDSPRPFGSQGGMPGIGRTETGEHAQGREGSNAARTQAAPRRPKLAELFRGTAEPAVFVGEREAQRRAAFIGVRGRLGALLERLRP